MLAMRLAVRRMKPSFPLYVTTMLTNFSPLLLLSYQLLEQRVRNMAHLSMLQRQQ